MSVARATKAYVGTARKLSRYWNRSFTVTLARMLASRVIHGRGPVEFDKYRFIEKPLSLWRSFVVDNELHAMQRAVSPAEFVHLDEDKAAFASHCEDSGLPTPGVIAVTAARPGSVTRETRYPVAHDARELADVLASLGDFEGFAKPRCGGIGWGTFAFTLQGGAITTRNGAGDASYLFDRCASSAQAANGYVLQRRVRQHPAFAHWMPGPALGTMRILTFRMPDGSVTVPYAALKLPAPDAEADNVRIGALQASIDVLSGTMGPAVGRTPSRPVVHAMDRHPFTGAEITGASVPFWDDVRALVTRGAHAFSMLPALGWDVGVTADGPMLIEANVMFGVPDLPYERGLAAEMRALFARVARAAVS